jgi:hypothetical protein
MNTAIRQKWRDRIRQWQVQQLRRGLTPVGPMPISADDEAELCDEFGMGYCSPDLQIVWFGDPHFGQRFRVVVQSP